MVGVHAQSNGRRGDHFAGISVNDSHDFIVAAGQQAAVRGVDGHARGAFARSQRPGSRDYQRFGIDLLNLAFVFEVDVDVAGAVGRREFGLAAEGDGGQHVAGDGVNCGGILAEAVHGKNALGRGIVDDGIRIFPRLRVADRLQRLHVKNCDGAGLAVGCESVAEFRSESDAMHPRRIRNCADDFLGVDVKNVDPSAAGDEQAACG